MVKIPLSFDKTNTRSTHYYYLKYLKKNKHLSNQFHILDFVLPNKKN